MPSTADPALDVQAFRSKHEDAYRREFVPLAGLFALKDGINTVGAAAAHDIVLPEPAAATVGRLVVAGDRVRFEPAATALVTLNGTPVDSPVDVKSDAHGAPDALAIGDLRFWVHMSGARQTVRLYDPNGPEARGFPGFRWFPYDAQFRVEGRMVRDATPSQVAIPNQLGDDETFTTEGVVEFAIDGRTCTLRPMTTRPGRLFFVFRDGTSGVETYGVARFLYTDLAEDGSVILDFNRAYHPPCAFSPYTTCPLPPPENRLTVRILAGERL